MTLSLGLSKILSLDLLKILWFVLMTTLSLPLQLTPSLALLLPLMTKWRVSDDLGFDLPGWLWCKVLSHSDARLSTLHVHWHELPCLRLLPTVSQPFSDADLLKAWAPGENNFQRGVREKTHTHLNKSNNTQTKTVAFFVTLYTKSKGVYCERNF